ncbi:MAG: hypothetical protein DYG96_11625, partial [Chlorobi bacterium CHB2]|nr:hypothetical protein [Chlorobi bacterium CHB2]
MAVGFTRVGVHELNECKEGVGRLSGMVYPLGRLSKDGPVGWLLEYERCDTLVPNGGYPKSFWLVESVGGDLPLLEDHQVIGATELGTETRFVGSGDYDGNGVVDIVVRIQQFNDTSFGNNKGYGLGVVAVFYGNSKHEYSLQDTIRLSNGSDAWFGGTPLVSYDANNDGVDDLLVGSGLGWSAGIGRVEVAEVLGYYGVRGKKWGRDGSSNGRVWEWWEVP